MTWDEEEPDDDWEDDDSGETIVVPCPVCRADVYEDAEQCPSCGHYVVHTTSPWAGKPRWWIIGGLAGIAAVIWVLVRVGWW
jgi:hypothetical protein